MGVDDSRIAMVTSTTRCKKHQAAVGESCWVLYSHDGYQTNMAICGNRVKKAGFNGGNPAIHGPVTASVYN